jgi:hypothetical protein
MRKLSLSIVIINLNKLWVIHIIWFFFVNFKLKKEIVINKFNIKNIWKLVGGLGM